MNSQESIDGFSPSTEKSSDVDYDNVLVDYIEKKGCTYPAEIRREIGISKDTMYVHLHQLEQKGAIKRHNLMGEKDAPDWIRPRLQELWARGLKGNRIRGMAWYTLADIKEDNAHDVYKQDQTYKKKTLALNAEMNRERDVEPTEEQKKAEEELRGPKDSL